MVTVTFPEMMTVHAAEFPASPQPAAFPLQGSKRGQVPIINRLIPEDATTLVEPFCGSAAVSIGARHHRRVQNTVISDSNRSIADLWKSILTDPEGLADRYTRVWNGQLETPEVDGKRDTKAYFNIIRDRYNDAGKDGDPADFLFLLNRIVKSALRYSSVGRMNQSADGRRMGTKPKTVCSRLLDTRDALEGSTVLCRDYTDALAEAGVDDLIYLDPPYQGTTDTVDKRYISGLSVDDFEEQIRSAVDGGLSLIISYDALRGPAIYGRPLDPAIGLLPLDIITGVSAQGTLLGRKMEAHETLYLSPALVDRLGGTRAVADLVKTGSTVQSELVFPV